MSNAHSNITAALAEPARFARHDGTLYYACELGPTFAVNEGELLETIMADLGAEHVSTSEVDVVPTEAVTFELGGNGEEPAFTSADAAIDAWATLCDERAAAA